MKIVVQDQQTQESVPNFIPDNRTAKVFMKTELDDALEKVRVLYENCMNILNSMKDRMLKVDVDDIELGYHELFFKESTDLLEEITGTMKALKSNNAVRFFQCLVPRKIDGIVVLGRKFTIDAQFIPGAPSEKDDPEKYHEYIEGIRKTQYSGIIKEQIAWKALQKMVHELADKGLPPPLHVKLYPKPTIKITKEKTK